MSNQNSRTRTKVQEARGEFVIRRDLGNGSVELERPPEWAQRLHATIAAAYFLSDLGEGNATVQSLRAGGCTCDALLRCYETDRGPAIDVRHDSHCKRLALVRAAGMEDTQPGCRPRDPRKSPGSGRVR